MITVVVVRGRSSLFLKTKPENTLWILSTLFCPVLPHRSTSRLIRGHHCYQNPPPPPLSLMHFHMSNFDFQELICKGLGLCFIKTRVVRFPWMHWEKYQASAVKMCQFMPHETMHHWWLGLHRLSNAAVCVDLSALTLHALASECAEVPVISLHFYWNQLFGYNFNPSSCFDTPLFTYCGLQPHPKLAL